LWSVAQAQNELKADQKHADIAQDDKDVFANMVAERVHFRIRQRTGNEVEGKVEVGQGEKGKEERDELIDEFDVQQNLPSKGMVGLPDLLEVYQGVDGSKESAIQPTSSL